MTDQMSGTPKARSAKKVPITSPTQAKKINVSDELDALSGARSKDRLRLAHWARKARLEIDRYYALKKLRRRLDQILTDVLPVALTDRGWLVRSEALEIIAEHELTSFEPAAIQALKDRHPLVQDRAVWALAVLKTPAGIRAVKRFLPHAATRARVSAEGFLYTIDRDGRRVDRLIAFLNDDDHLVRRASANELAYVIRKRDMKRSIAAIEAVIGREQYRVHKLALRRQIRHLRGRFAP